MAPMTRSKTSRTTIEDKKISGKKKKKFKVKKMNKTQNKNCTTLNQNMDKIKMYEHAMRCTVNIGAQISMSKLFKYKRKIIPGTVDYLKRRRTGVINSDEPSEFIGPFDDIFVTKPAHSKYLWDLDMIMQSKGPNGTLSKYNAPLSKLNPILQQLHPAEMEEYTSPLYSIGKCKPISSITFNEVFQKRLDAYHLETGEKNLFRSQETDLKQTSRQKTKRKVFILLHNALCKRLNYRHKYSQPGYIDKTFSLRTLLKNNYSLTMGPKKQDSYYYVLNQFGLKIVEEYCNLYGVNESLKDKLLKTANNIANNKWNYFKNQTTRDSLKNNKKNKEIKNDPITNETSVVVNNDTIINKTSVVVKNETIINKTSVVVTNDTIINETSVVVINDTIINETSVVQVFKKKIIMKHRLNVKHRFKVKNRLKALKYYKKLYYTNNFNTNLTKHKFILRGLPYYYIIDKDPQVINRRCLIKPILDIIIYAVPMFVKNKIICNEYINLRNTFFYRNCKLFISSNSGLQFNNSFNDLVLKYSNLKAIIPFHDIFFSTTDLITFDQIYENSVQFINCNNSDDSFTDETDDLVISSVSKPENFDSKYYYKDMPALYYTTINEDEETIGENKTDSKRRRKKKKSHRIFSLSTNQVDLSYDQYKLNFTNFIESWKIEIVNQKKCRYKKPDDNTPKYKITIQKFILINKNKDSNNERSEYNPDNNVMPRLRRYSYTFDDDDDVESSIDNKVLGLSNDISEDEDDNLNNDLTTIIIDENNCDSPINKETIKSVIQDFGANYKKMLPYNSITPDYVNYGEDNTDNTNKVFQLLQSIVNGAVSDTTIVDNVVLKYAQNTPTSISIENNYNSSIPYVAVSEEIIDFEKTYDKEIQDLVFNDNDPNETITSTNIQVNISLHGLVNEDIKNLLNNFRENKYVFTTEILSFYLNENMGPEELINCMVKVVQTNNGISTFTLICNTCKMLKSRLNQHGIQLPIEYNNSMENYLAVHKQWFENKGVHTIRDILVVFIIRCLALHFEKELMDDKNKNKRLVNIVISCAHEQNQDTEEGNVHYSHSYSDISNQYPVVDIRTHTAENFEMQLQNTSNINSETINYMPYGIENLVVRDNMNTMFNELTMKDDYTLYTSILVPRLANTIYNSTGVPYNPFLCLGLFPFDQISIYTTANTYYNMSIDTTNECSDQIDKMLEVNLNQILSKGDDKVLSEIDFDCYPELEELNPSDEEIQTAIEMSVGFNNAGILMD